MSTTRWRLVLEDLFSKPAKGASKITDFLAGRVENLHKKTNKYQEELKVKLNSEIQNREKLAQSIKSNERYLAVLNKRYEETGIELFDQQASTLNFKLEAQNAELDGLDTRINEYSRSIDAFAEKAKRLDKVNASWHFLSSTVNQFADALKFGQEYKEIEMNIGRMTGLHGNALRDITQQAYKLGEVHKVSGLDIAKSANAVAQTYGMSFDDAFAKIEEGFKKGANLNGDFLSRITSQPMADMGFTLDETIAKMAILNQKGISTSDAFRAFERVNVTLNEMSESTRAALSGVGIVPDDLEGKTVKEIMDIVSEAMDNGIGTMQDKQTLMTNLFGRGGRAMGTAIKEAISESATALDEIEVVEDTSMKIRGFLADVKGFVADATGSFASSLTELAPVFTGIGSGITLFQNLSKVTWAQNLAVNALTVVTRVMNAVIKSGPFGWAALAIGVVSTAVTLLSDKFDWAAGIVEGVKASFMSFGKALVQMVFLPVIQGIELIKGLGKAISALLKGDFKGAGMAVVDGITQPFKDIGSNILKGSKEAAAGYRKGVKDFGNKKGKESAARSIDPGTYDPNVVSFNKNEEGAGGSSSGGGGGSSSKDGMSLSGGTGKGYTMNLNIVNNFNGKINSRADIRELAEEVMGVVVDRGRDFVLSV